MGTTLYHATPQGNLDNILQQGMRSHSYWTDNKRLLFYYIETIEDDGDDAAVVAVDLTAFNLGNIHPDFCGLEEPITTVIGRSEEDVIKQWSESNHHWQDCLTIIGSICYHDSIPPSFLSVCDMGNL